MSLVLRSSGGGRGDGDLDDNRRCHDRLYADAKLLSSTEHSPDRGSRRKGLRLSARAVERRDTDLHTHRGGAQTELDAFHRHVEERAQRATVSGGILPRLLDRARDYQRERHQCPGEGHHGVCARLQG